MTEIRLVIQYYYYYYRPSYCSGSTPPSPSPPGAWHSMSNRLLRGIALHIAVTIFIACLSHITTHNAGIVPTYPSGAVAIPCN